MAAIASSPAVGGAAVAFFMDIDQGRRRRALARQRLAATARRVVGRGGRAARYLGSAAAGAARRVPHPRSAQQPRPMTSRSCRKVETEIFRGADMPKRSINVNAEDGVRDVQSPLSLPGSRA